MNCKQCISSLYPEDPRKPFFTGSGYLKPLCYYCSEYNPDTETPEPREIIHRHSEMGKKEFAELQRLSQNVKILMKKQDKKQDNKPPF